MDIHSVYYELCLEQSPILSNETSPIYVAKPVRQDAPMSPAAADLEAGCPCWFRAAGRFYFKMRVNSTRSAHELLILLSPIAHSGLSACRV